MENTHKFGMENTHKFSMENTHDLLSKSFGISSISSQSGQGIVEYALIIVLIALAVIAALIGLGAATGNSLGLVAGKMATPTPGTSTAAIIADFNARMLAFYNLHGSWPRTWSPYNFTDIGLNPSDWSQPVNGLYFSPHGSEVAIANVAGDNLQVYVKDLNGNTLHLYDTWAIWCPVNSSTCYYHTVAPGNEVNISTIYTTGG